MNKQSQLFMARVIRWDGSSVVNICDAELLGCTVKGDGLEVSISRDYFGGDPVDLDRALEMVRSSMIVNLVGKRIVTEVLRSGMANKLAVKSVGKVLFLMIFKFMSRS